MQRATESVASTVKRLRDGLADQRTTAHAPAPLRTRLGRRLLPASASATDSCGRRARHSYDEGIDFRAKLIGEQDVAESRGELMCQAAMRACKVLPKR